MEIRVIGCNRQAASSVSILHPLTTCPENSHVRVVVRTIPKRSWGHLVRHHWRADDDLGGTVVLLLSLARSEPSDLADLYLCRHNSLRICDWVNRLALRSDWSRCEGRRHHSGSRQPGGSLRSGDSECCRDYGTHRRASGDCHACLCSHGHDHPREQTVMKLKVSQAKRVQP